MPVSMTGFGRGSVDGKMRRYVVEARAVNNRFCEVKINAPKEFLELEHLLSRKIRETFVRGKFEILLKYERLKPRKKALDPKLVAERWKELEQIRKKLGLKEPVSLATAIELLPSPNDSDDADPQAEKFFLKAAGKALDQLRDFRKREGKNLSHDILRRALKLDQVVSRIVEAEKGTKEARKIKLEARISELMTEKTVDAKRMETEVALLVDRADVSEEIVRFRSHVARLKELALSERDVGRELDFLLQELNREINTIGSKASDLGTVDEVIVAKAEIEKIREQAQNLE
jgi:uncharacterized protein (TIGR00255 family)